MPKKKNINWLNNPFPFVESNREKLISSFAFAGFIYLFLLIFRPFGISRVQMSIPVYLLGFFFITLIIMLLSNMVLPAIFKNAFNPDKWDVKKSIFFNTGIIMAIGFFNWLYNHSLSNDLTIDHSLGYFMLITFGVAIIPSSFFILVIENYLRQKNSQIATTLEKSLKHPILEIHEEILSIPSENENENLKLSPSQLICMKSEGNYVQFYFVENEQVKSKLLRISMNKLEMALNRFNEFKRCHRSYMANFNRVAHVSGNARNYNLHFANLDFAVPISRNFPKEMILEMKKN